MTHAAAYTRSCHGFSVTYGTKYETSAIPTKTFEYALKKHRLAAYADPVAFHLDVLDKIPPQQVTAVFPDVNGKPSLPANRFRTIRGQWYFALFKGRHHHRWKPFYIKRYFIQKQDGTIDIMPGVMCVFSETSMERGEKGISREVTRWGAYFPHQMSLYRCIRYADADVERFEMAFSGVLQSVDKEIDHQDNSRPRLSLILSKFLRRAYNISKHIRQWMAQRHYSLVYQTFTFFAYLLKYVNVPADLYDAFIRYCHVTESSIQTLDYPDILIPEWLDRHHDAQHKVEHEKFQAHHDNIAGILNLSQAVRQSDITIICAIMEKKFRKKC